MWAATTALALCLSQSAPAADPIGEGRKALEAGQYASAAEWFEKAVAADPKDYVSLFHLALAQSLMGKDAEAIVGYRKVLELQPGLFQAQLNLGMVLVRAKRPAEAAPLFEQAAAQKPQDYRPRLYLGDAELASGQPAKAEESYKAAIEANAKSGAAELGLAKAMAEQGRLDDADPHFRHAVELDGALKPALLELAVLYEKAGRREQAISIYGQFPENVAARERLGELLVEADRPAEAIPHLEWAVAHSPTAANRLSLAMAYKKNKQPEKEMPLIEQAVEAEPGNLDLRLAYGRELRDQRKFAQAAHEFALIVEAQPRNVQGWQELVAMLVSLEQYPQALAALDRIRALGAEQPAHLYLRAIVQDHEHDRKNAVESYRQFLAASQGKSPNEEFKARQRIHILELELGKR